MHGSGQNLGAETTVATALDAKALDSVLGSCKDVESFCAELAKLFRVRQYEVALLRLEGGLLKFLFPNELKTAGSIPVSSATAVAAHTAITKKVDLFNSFTKVKHASIFETVKLGNPDDDAYQNAPIQKLMSAPILSKEGKVLGVLQICRKGLDRKLIEDFTLEDLQKLEAAAKVSATTEFMRE